MLNMYNSTGLGCHLSRSLFLLSVVLLLLLLLSVVMLGLFYGGFINNDTDNMIFRPMQRCVCAVSVQMLLLLKQGT